MFFNELWTDLFKVYENVTECPMILNKQMFCAIAMNEY